MISTEAEARVWLSTVSGYNSEVELKLAILVARLISESARQNLIAKSTIGSIWQRHIADSAQLLSYVPRETRTWVDLGSGAGFPGLVAAIFMPDVRLALVENRPLRARWLEHVSAELSLDNVVVYPAQAQAVMLDPVSIISARAFAPLGRLVDLATRFSTAETLWLLPKGQSARDELRTLFGWKHTFHVEQSITDPSAGIIVGRLIGKARRQ